MAQTLEEKLALSTLWLERYDAQTLKEIEIKLGLAQEQIIKLISETKNLSKIQTEINKVMEESFSTFDTVLNDDVEQIKEIAWNTTGAIMSAYVSNEAFKSFKKWGSIKGKTKEKLLSPKTRIQGFTLEDHLKNIKGTNARKVRGIITKGFDDGLGIDEINRQIKNTFNNISRNTGKTLVRTALLENIRSTQYQLYDLLKTDDTLYYYNSVLDTRTTFRCWNLHRKKFTPNAEEIIKLLDFHYSCRATLGVSTQISRDEEATAKQNVVEWDAKKVKNRGETTPSGNQSYKTRFKVKDVTSINRNATPEGAYKVLSEENKRKFLGKRRYELWKSGKATFDDMFSLSRSTPIPYNQLIRNLRLE